VADDSFYLPLGEDRWLATKHTTGPWDPGAQHGGPPSALLGRAITRCEPRPDMVVARFTAEILGAVPVDELTVRARVLRPGRSVELVEAVAAAGGRDVIRATAWRVLRTTSDSVPAEHPEPPPLPSSESTLAVRGWVDGYLSSIDWRMTRGAFGKPGPATAWTRMRYPLVPDEQPGPLERVLIVADSGNGLSGTLDITGWYFINPELTVHLHREAAGEWVLIDARTTISAGGAGLATTTLCDQHGPIGTGAQSLLIKAR
jgi:Thioesterase-like superfamily